MLKSLISTLFVLVSAHLFAQDSVMYSRDFELKDGIYLSFSDFKNNNPIPRSRIQTKYDRGSFDFYQQEMKKSAIIYIDNAKQEQEIKTEKIWGFCTSGSLYINYGKEFNKVIKVGSICHFAASVPVYYRSYDPYYDYAYNRPNYEFRQLILDFSDGKIGEFSVENLEVILKRDDQIYSEFSALSKKKKRDSLFLYLNKYNDKHPIYFKIN